MNKTKLKVLITAAAFALLPLFTLPALAIDNVPYMDGNGQSQVANGVNEIDATTATLTTGWWVVPAGAPIVINTGITVSGNVHGQQRLTGNRNV